MIHPEAVLAFDEYYSEWDKKLCFVPPYLAKRDTLFGDDELTGNRGYTGEVKVTEVFLQSKITGIFISNFTNEDQNNILQAKSKVTFECNFILLTKNHGLLVEVCDSSKTRIQSSIREKFEQLIKNRNHILKLAKTLYGGKFCNDLAVIYNGIVAIPNARTEDFEDCKNTEHWQNFMNSNAYHTIEFIGEDNISKPYSAADFIYRKELHISPITMNHLKQFYATLTLVMVLSLLTQWLNINKSYIFE